MIFFRSLLFNIFLYLGIALASVVASLFLFFKDKYVLSLGRFLSHYVLWILKIFEDITNKIKGNTIKGEDVFRLYDTYGFPVDLTADIARERNIKVDMIGFNKAMAGQRQRARGASKFDAGVNVNTDNNLVSAFTGYERLEQKTTVIALYQDGRNVKSLSQGEIGGVILLETPFYAQSGGQEIGRAHV